jgi:TM2 domain-containing membrane protein YozV
MMSRDLQRCPQSGCGHLNPRDAYYCAACGERLPNAARGPLDFQEEAHGMRSVGVAYGLWALSFVLVAGVHRFYLGRYITGIIWLLTGGLFFIGTIIDAFLIPGMTEDKNRELAGRGSWSAP